MVMHSNGYPEKLESLSSETFKMQLDRDLMPALL